MGHIVEGKREFQEEKETKSGSLASKSNYLAIRGCLVTSFTGEKNVSDENFLVVPIIKSSEYILI